jgi:hypothetical protein
MGTLDDLAALVHGGRGDKPPRRPGQTRIVALALALIMIAPAAEAADHNASKGRSRAIVILLGKANPPHTPPRRHEHHPLHGARPQLYAQGGARDPVIATRSSGWLVPKTRTPSI